MLVLLQPHTTLCASELPGADRIFGAICWGLRAVAGSTELDRLLSACGAGDPPLLLSAGFPWVRLGNRRVELLPRPMLPSAPKTARYVSRQLWEQLVRPAVLGEGVGRVLELGQVALAAGDVASMTKLPTSVPIPRTTSVVRRSVLRATLGQPCRFERSELAFPAGVGWGFLLHLRRPEWRDPLVGAIAWVCDTGWGAARSIGKGAAEVYFEDSPLPAEELSTGATPTGATPTGETSSVETSSGLTTRFISLSAWHPTPPQRASLATQLTVSDAGTCEYALTLRDGWAHPNQPVTLVREGSVLPWPATTPATTPGAIEDTPSAAAPSPRSVAGCCIRLPGRSCPPAFPPAP